MGKQPDNGQNGVSDWVFEYERSHSANREYSYQEITSDANIFRRCLKSERFEIRTGDVSEPDRIRTDGIRERSEMAQMEPRNYEEEKFWYGWSFFIPANYVESGNAPGTSKTVAIAQFHQEPCDHDAQWYPAFMFGKKYDGPFVLRVFPTHPTLAQAEIELLSQADFAGKWHDVVVEAMWSTRGNGYFHVWVDDVLKHKHIGPTMSKDNVSVYFKYGVYRPSTPKLPVTTVVYFDKPKRAKTRAEVDIRMLEKN
ncbi:polysaccharide lyase [Undibacterium terreum]|nr:polysaccharide lyase [Undibacterium terreum]